MTKLTFNITMSLDGFIAGPNPRTEAPLGDGGECRPAYWSPTSCISELASTYLIVRSDGDNLPGLESVASPAWRLG